MNNKGKYIGISNRIPLIVLEYAIGDYISSGQVNSSSYYSYIKEFTKGENRAKKTLSHLLSIINKNINILELVKRNSADDFYSLRKSERHALILCLYTLTFPINYDILTVFAVGFKVQEYISKRVIIEKIGAIYGSNRSMHIGVDESIPLNIEIKLLDRTKKGIYRMLEKLTVVNQTVLEIIIYTDIKLSGSKTIMLEDISHKPWYSYFSFSANSIENSNTLFVKKESSIGKGYLTI